MAEVLRFILAREMPQLRTDRQLSPPEIFKHAEMLLTHGQVTAAVKFLNAHRQHDLSLLVSQALSSNDAFKLHVRGLLASP